MVEMPASIRAALAQRGRRLEYFTIAWNAVEGMIAVAAGGIAGSISLMGFGMDSFIEMTSSAAMLWRMAADQDSGTRERNEKRALKIVGACFVALAVYLTSESLADLIDRRTPEHSLPGILLACVSLVVMPLLSREKKKVGRDLGSAAMDADARQTDFCAILSAILLIGLLLNAAFGLWWADTMAAMAMVSIIAREGIDGWREKPCRECRGDPDGGAARSMSFHTSDK
jgi:divalent metal cation (Fe/Co/Zn/Cd) transporter